MVQLHHLPILPKMLTVSELLRDSLSHESQYRCTRIICIKA
jgi:hypothetical protein